MTMNVVVAQPGKGSWLQGDKFTAAGVLWGTADGMPDRRLVRRELSLFRVTLRDFFLHTFG